MINVKISAESVFVSMVGIKNYVFLLAKIMLDLSKVTHAHFVKYIWISTEKTKFCRDCFTAEITELEVT